MTELTLFFFPGACSHVTMCALEQAQLPYRAQFVNLATGEQASNAFKEIVPTRKVPALLVDGELLVENAAILFYLARSHPQAELLPEASAPFEVAEQLSALAFCASTLHPLTRAIYNPSRLTAGDVEAVRARAKETAATPYGFAERRLKERGWWFGTWSIVDVYVNWAFTLARKGGLDIEPYPTLAGLHDRLMQFPCYPRTLAREDAARREHGLA